MWKGTAAKSPLLRIMVFLSSIMQMPLIVPMAEAPITETAIILKSQVSTAAGYKPLPFLTVKMWDLRPAHQALKGPFSFQTEDTFSPTPKAAEAASTSLCHDRENTKPLFVRQGTQWLTWHTAISGLEGLRGESVHGASFIRFTCPGSMF